MNELGDRFADVLRAAAGADRAAFAELWRSAHPGLIRYLCVVCGSALAKDVASEAWIRVIRGLPRFSGGESDFRGWLAVIARNRAIDLVRSAARRPETLVPEVSEHRQPSSPDAADEALGRLSTEAAIDLVRTLPPAVAEMVMLRVVMGLDVAEVAVIVDRTPGAVRVAVHRALKSLAETLGRDAPVTEGPSL